MLIRFCNRIQRGFYCAEYINKLTHRKNIIVQLITIQTDNMYRYYYIIILSSLTSHSVGIGKYTILQ